MRGLRHVGLEQDVLALGGRPAVLERAEFANWRGRLLGAFPVDEMERRLGAPTVGVSRSGLHAVLAGALGPAALRLGRTCTGFARDGSSVSVLLDGGGSERGEVLIGADGLHSVVRAQLHGAREPRFAGYTSCQAFTEFEAPPGLLRVFFGPAARFLFYPVGPGRLYWEAIFVAEEGGRGGREVVEQRFRSWPAPIEAIVEATAPEAVWRADVHDRPPLKRWGEGPVTLLGDAAHAMTNAIAQGANMAIEDAIVLARLLARGGDPVAALRAYEARRERRTGRLVRSARFLSAAARWRRPWALRLRDRLLGTIAFSSFGFRQQLKEVDYDF